MTATFMAVEEWKEFWDEVGGIGDPSIGSSCAWSGGGRR